MTPAELRKLADEATPGPWEFSDSTDPRGHKGEFRAPNPYNGFMLVGPWTNDADAPLMALAPDLARLCAELGEALREIHRDAYRYHQYWSQDKAHAALAKLAELETPPPFVTP